MLDSWLSFCVIPEQRQQISCPDVVADYSGHCDIYPHCPVASLLSVLHRISLLGKDTLINLMKDVPFKITIMNIIRKQLIELLHNRGKEPLVVTNPLRFEKGCSQAQIYRAF